MGQIIIINFKFMSRGKWSRDIGYEDEEDLSEDGDILEDIERLLEEKLGQLFGKLQNSNKQLLESIQLFQQTLQDTICVQKSLKEQETHKEWLTKCEQETTK